MTAPAPVDQHADLDIAAAADEAARRLLPELHARIESFGMPEAQARSVRLVWDGHQFRAVSDDLRLRWLEYGDGKVPPLAAVRKAMNRVLPALLEEMSSILDEDVEHLLEGVAF